MYSWIPIIASIFLALKSGVEIYQTTMDYNKDKFTENSVLHTNQHFGILYGIFIFSISIPYQIIKAGFVFPEEWILTLVFLDVVILYAIEHFSHERKGEIKPINLTDLFRIDIRFKKKIKSQNHEKL